MSSAETHFNVGDHVSVSSGPEANDSRWQDRPVVRVSGPPLAQFVVVAPRSGPHQEFPGPQLTLVSGRGFAGFGACCCPPDAENRNYALSIDQPNATQRPQLTPAAEKLADMISDVLRWCGKGGVQERDAALVPAVVEAIHSRASSLATEVRALERKVESDQKVWDSLRQLLPEHEAKKTAEHIQTVVATIPYLGSAQTTRRNGELPVHAIERWIRMAFEDYDREIITAAGVDIHVEFARLGHVGPEQAAMIAQTLRRVRSRLLNSEVKLIRERDRANKLEEKFRDGRAQLRVARAQLKVSRNEVTRLESAAKAAV